MIVQSMLFLTNYELDDFADQFGDYDYELQKSEITSRYIKMLQKRWGELAV